MIPTLLLLAALVYLGVKQPYLFIATEAGIYRVIPVKTDAKFSLSFTHSVQLTPVIENFRVDDSNMIILESTEYQSFGVGLPFLASDGNFHAEEGYFVVSDMKRQHKRIDVRTGPEAKLSLTYGGQTIPLYAVFPPGTLIHLWVGPFYSQWPSS